MHEFSRYSELISRPVVKKILLNERQYLLSVLTEYIDKIFNDPNNTSVISTKYEISQVVSELLTNKQLETRALEVQNISRELLDDLNNYEVLSQKLAETMSIQKQQTNELFESWTNKITTQIKNNGLR